MQQFKVGEERPHANGRTYVYQGEGKWRLKPGSTSPVIANPLYGAESTIKTNTAAASAYEPRQAQESIETSNINQEGTSLSNEEKRYSNSTKPTYDRLGAMDKIRDSIRQDKRILKYEEALPIYADAIGSGEGTAADNFLVNAMAKVSDPDTGVNTRESEAMEDGQSTVDQIKQRLLKEYGNDGAGNFTPEARKAMRAVVNSRMEKLADSYNSARTDWRQYVKAAGIPDLDPEVVLGPHFGAKFQQYEADYDKSPVQNLDGSIGAVPKAVQPLSASGVVDRLAGADGALQVDITDDRMPGETDEQYIARIEGGQAAAPVIPNQRQGQSGFGQTVDAFGRGVADTLTLGLSDEIAAAGGTLFNGGTMLDNLARERGVDNYDTQNNFGARLTGQIGGGLLLPTTVGSVGKPAGIQALRSGLPMAEARAAATSATRNRGLQEAGMFGTGYGFGSSDGNFTDRLKGAAAGGATGVAGGLVVDRLGAAVAPVRDRGLQALKEIGVTGSVGQQGPQWLNNLEDKLQVLPVSGALARHNRTKPVEQLNNGVLNLSLKPLGAELPKGIAAGTAAMGYTKKQFNAAYEKARGGMQFADDADFQTALADMRSRIAGGELDEAAGRRFEQIVNDKITRRVTNGAMDGDRYKRSASQIGKLAKATRQSNPELSTMLVELRTHFDDAAVRSSSPEAADLLKRADKGYRTYATAKNAALKVGGDAGTFTPRALRSEVQKADPGAYLTGNAHLQDIADAAAKRLPDGPDSQTASRGAAGLAALASGGAAAGVFNPAYMIPYAAGELMNLIPQLPGIKQGVQALTTAERPKLLDDAGQLLRRNARIGGMFGAPMGLQYTPVN